MGFKTYLYLSQFILTQYLCFTRVSADFCDWFICHPTEQYCCGNNICCNYFNYNSFYLWCGAVMFGAFLVVLYYVLCSPTCMRNQKSDDTLLVLKKGEQADVQLAYI